MLVALRKESVDRNSFNPQQWHLAQHVALRKESVDRNGFGAKLVHSFLVALRKESVDRNCKINTRGSEKMKSLSARRAWIEMFRLMLSVRLLMVALRKESVDRNYRRL